MFRRNRMAREFISEDPYQGDGDLRYFNGSVDDFESDEPSVLDTYDDSVGDYVEDGDDDALFASDYDEDPYLEDEADDMDMAVEDDDALFASDYDDLEDDSDVFTEDDVDLEDDDLEDDSDVFAEDYTDLEGDSVDDMVYTASTHQSFEDMSAVPHAIRLLANNMMKVRKVWSSNSRDSQNVLATLDALKTAMLIFAGVLDSLGIDSMSAKAAAHDFAAAASKLGRKQWVADSISPRDRTRISLGLKEAYLALTEAIKNSVALTDVPTELDVMAVFGDLSDFVSSLVSVGKAFGSNVTNLRRVKRLLTKNTKSYFGDVFEDLPEEAFRMASQRRSIAQRILRACALVGSKPQQANMILKQLLRQIG